MDRLAAMSVFVAVAELKGFAPAARRHGLSPSAVTRLIAGLEDRLGVRLLQRTTRSVALTDAGVRYLERVRRILSDVSEAEGEAHKERAMPSGRLVVTAPYLFGRLHVAPLMCDFLSKYPSVVGELLLGDRVVNLVEGGVDVAVRIGVLDDSSHVARRVGETRRVIVAAPAYLAKHKAVRSPKDLASHRTIQFNGINPTPEWRFIQKGRERRFSFKPGYITNSADAAVYHAERGGGLTMVLSYQVAEAVHSGRLKVVLSRFEPPPLPIHVMYPSTHLLSAKVRAFIDLVCASSDWHF